MKLHRFIIPDLELVADTTGIADPHLVHQLRTVLRLKPEDQILVANGTGYEALATIREYRDGAVMLALGEPYPLETEPPRSVTLYAAISKRDTFEWTVQKAVECGATRIVPLISERTIKQNVNLQRLRFIAREAAEQSGRGIVPEIGDRTTFEDALLDASSLRLFASTQGGTAVASMDLSGADAVALMVGPEGGWSEKEEQLATDAGWQPITLGTRILRAETAAIIATYLVAK